MGGNSSVLGYDCLTLKKALKAFETSAATRRITQRHILEDLNRKENR